ncbi:hypothetical protein CPB86DRAFT_809824 [Serendipita vermifera]|nr:hypothetical protein CPB86DRAFT_809824 [Serendipita vermifera]
MKGANGISFVLLGMGMIVTAYADGTVVQTATSIIPGSTSSTATPTPTYSSSSSPCVGWECGSTSCIPSTTSLLLYVCETSCLNDSTFTYTTTTYPPPITQTLPCNGKFAKKDEFEDIEKRWTCVPGPTITSYTSMACSDCSQFPTLTTTTKSVVETVYESCSTVLTESSSSSSTLYPTPTPACWWTCSGPAGYTTIYVSDAAPTATPTGYDWCGLACA